MRPPSLRRSSRLLLRARRSTRPLSVFPAAAPSLSRPSPSRSRPSPRLERFRAVGRRHGRRHEPVPESLIGDMNSSIRVTSRRYEARQSLRRGPWRDLKGGGFFCAAGAGRRGLSRPRRSTRRWWRPVPRRPGPRLTSNTRWQGELHVQLPPVRIAGTGDDPGPRADLAHGEDGRKPWHYRRIRIDAGADRTAIQHLTQIIRRFRWCQIHRS